MNKQEDIAKALKARLSELKRRVAEIDRELHTQLSADSEEQAIDLENQEALGAIENFGAQEIHRIEQTLKRISEGTYGICARCGADIDHQRLKALPRLSPATALKEDRRGSQRWTCLEYLSQSRTPRSGLRFCGWAKLWFRWRKTLMAQSRITHDPRRADRTEHDRD
jgi:RNA polymerase-binding transcription factor DksA